MKCLSEKIGRVKSQLQLLTAAKHYDVFTSLRPRIGKRYCCTVLEQQKCDALDSCRLQLVEISETVLKG